MPEMIKTTAFPSEGYPNLELSRVFWEHGIVHGLTELDRRSFMPPTATAKAEIAAGIIGDMIYKGLINLAGSNTTSSVE